VADPDIYNHDDDDDDTNDIQDEIISESNYWKKIPRFSTSSNYKKKTFHWRSYPILTNRRSDGNQVETGYWVPGAPGPLVWGDMAGQLKLKKMKKDFLKFLNSRKTRRSTR